MTYEFVINLGVTPPPPVPDAKCTHLPPTITLFLLAAQVPGNAHLKFSSHSISLPLSVFHRSIQTLADISKQEALRNDLMEALKRKQQS